MLPRVLPGLLPAILGLFRTALRGMVRAMFVRKLIQCSLLAALAIPTALSIGACGNGSDVKHAQIKAGEKPAGGEWQGGYLDKGFRHPPVSTDGQKAQGP